MIGFYFKASAEIGTGHVRRCSVLARELAKSDRKIILFSDSKTIAFARRYMPEDCAFIEVEPDGNVFIEAVVSYGVSMLIMDTYNLDDCIESELNNTVQKLVIIADFQNRKRACDILIDQNLGQNREGWRPYVHTNTKILAGPHYALLRPEFAKSRSLLQRDYIRDSSIPRVFVCFGGVDTTGITYDLLQKLLEDFETSICIDVVLGSGSLHLKRVVKYIAGFDGVNLHIDSDNIAPLMEKATISIGASGSMSLERCCLSLPSILISVADNQIESGKIAEKIGIGRYLGKYHKYIAEQISTELKQLMSKKVDLQLMSNICGKTVDGAGAQRISKILMNE